MTAARVLLGRSSSSSPHRVVEWQQYQSVRLLVKWARDRGLDHAVEREKNLGQMVALKNLIKAEASKSIPIWVAAENKTKLGLPTRAIEFIRKYPSIFQEYVPAGGIAARPHVRLTPEVVSLDQEEQLIYESESYLQDAANRLLKLIMLTRANRMPIHILDRLKWDLGLPPDYARTLVSQFPDFFQISPDCLGLELVWWSHELAVSALEHKAGKGYTKGMPLQFPLQYSPGYDLDKRVKSWLHEWQKLPYISPYEDASHLQSKSDQADKWTVAVLHELLHLFISKKTDTDNISRLAQYLGFGSRFKRCFINHPGIFYVSSKIRTHTVLLREAYKRDLLLQKHPLMGIRYQYIHLMNKLNHQLTSPKQIPPAHHYGDVSDNSEVEDDATTDDDNQFHVHQRLGRVQPDTKTPPSSPSKRKAPNMVGDKVPTHHPRKSTSPSKYASAFSSPGRTDHSRTRGRLPTERTYTR